MNDSKKAFYSYIGLFFVAMLWGLAFTVVKSSLDYVPPTYFVAIRFTVASIAISIIFAKKFKCFNKQNVLHGALIGVFLFFAYFTQTIGCNYTTAGKNAFLTALYVIVVPFLHWLITKKRPSYRLFIAAILAIVGIGLISLGNDMSIGKGELLSIACGVLFGCQIAYIDKYSETDDVMVLTMMQTYVSAILGWIFAPFTDGAINADAFKSTSVWLGILYIGIVSTLICNILQNVCQKYTKPENASLIMSTESVFGVLGSIIFLGEAPSVRMWIGCAIMMVAIVLAQLKTKEKS